jgi:ribosomal protein S18 acetylase RimI-like enzyme
MDAAHGDRGEVAEVDGRVAGGVSAVVAPPWMYVHPMVAADPAVAARLLARALTHAAAGVVTARIGVRVGEEAKRAAVVAAGFVPSLDFVDLRHDLAGTAPPPRPDGYRRVAHAAIDRPATHALHDRCFAEIANTAPLAPADFDLLLDGPMAWPAATAAWVDGDGRPRGFVFGQLGEDERGRFGVVDAIGVDPADRGHGLARTMLEELLTLARAEGLAEVRSLIAGDNTGSLALHRAAGFVEAGRRQMYDLALALATGA